MQTYHIIGTDTEIGKTTSCCLIMQYLQTKNKTITTIKPISSGLAQTKFGLINEDVARLLAASDLKLTATQINPFNFPQAIAPHIAAQLNGQELKLNKIREFILNPQITTEYMLVEGAGGVMVPLNSQETYLDLLQQLNQPIILIVGMKLGCLNHALLTIESLKQRNLNLAGWIANQIEPEMKNYTENYDYLCKTIQAPLLAEIKHNEKIQVSADFRRIFQCY